MNFYNKELKILSKKNLLRTQTLFPSHLHDFASNDYLGFSKNKDLISKAFTSTLEIGYFGARASSVICGHTAIAKDFLRTLCVTCGFETGLLFGSGFLANVGLIEALVRKNDILFLDEDFHASGVLASRLVKNVVMFKHNDAQDLAKKLQKYPGYRQVVAVEGVYSMSGAVLNPDIFEVCKNALLIVDEAHSVGVLGEDLTGVFSHFGITPLTNYIKMGTLSKALGGYGAYVLCEKSIKDFLLCRAKSLVYTTALSVADTAFALHAFNFMRQNAAVLKAKIQVQKRLASKYLNQDIQSLIVKVPCKSVLQVQKRLAEKYFLVGAIRPPTVKEEQLRLTLTLGCEVEILRELLKEVVYEKNR